MEVNVEDHVVEGGEKKHISYVVKCKLKNKEWTVKRRYNDFYTLNTTLLNNKIKVTAKLPPKMVFGNMNEQNISKRQLGLGEYIIALFKDDNLGDNADLLEFLSVKENTNEKSFTLSKSKEDKDICIALWDYKKQDDTELELKKGDKIKVLEKDEGSGWFYGYLLESPKHFGFFPHNYVTIGDAKSKNYVVEFDFVAEGQNELSIKVGEELELIDRKNGWCQVYNSKKAKGWVPHDYIRPLGTK